MARVFVSAAHKSSGKTTVSVGITAALRARGLAVQPFKKGPDYIDPMWLSAAAGRRCHNLDFHTMGHAEIRAEFARRSAGAELSLIEGNKGAARRGWRPAARTATPPSRSCSRRRSCSWWIRGASRAGSPRCSAAIAISTPGCGLPGVILNQVGGERHEAKLVARGAGLYGPPGARSDRPPARTCARRRASRASSLLPRVAAAGGRVERIARRIEADVDLDRGARDRRPGRDARRRPAALAPGRRPVPATFGTFG